MKKLTLVLMLMPMFALAARLPDWAFAVWGNPEVEIALKPGWNLIGYSFLEEGENETVLATAMSTSKIDFNHSGSRVFPGTLTTMAPGKGCWIHAAGAVTFGFDAP